jgi:phenylacetic acid degradation protein PaaD
LTADRVRSLFDRDPFAASLGIELVAAEPVTVRIAVDANHANFAGSTHGGVVFSLADCALSLASNAPGPPAVAIDTHLVLSAATAPGDVLTAVAEEVTRGARLATYRVEVSRGDGRVCGTFTGTVFISDDPAD